MAYRTITLNVREKTFDGQAPASLTVKVYPLATLTTRLKVVADSGGNVVLAGHVVKRAKAASGDDTSLMQITLPDPSDPVLNPNLFGYEVDVTTNYFSHTEKVTPAQIASLLVGGVLELEDFTDVTGQVDFDATLTYARVDALTSEVARATAAEATKVNSSTYTAGQATQDAALTGHTGNTSNPHGVTKAQVGLGNVDNTSDANKPVSTAQAAADAAVQSAAAADATTKVATETTRAQAAESTNASAIAANTTAINSEATTARAAELALRNLTDPTFAANLSASIDAQAPASTGARKQAAGGVVANGQNSIQGYSGNAVASDLGDCTINGGGNSGRENVIGLTDPATIGTTTPNAASTGSGADYSVILGGYDLGAGGLMSVIGGAHNYTARTTTHGTIVGGSLHAIKNGDYHVISGGTGNSIDTAGGSRCTIGGGDNHVISGVISGATIAGGRSNTATASQASIGGGLSNNASGDRSTIAGGNSNAASAQFASVGGGSANTASGARATVSGGSGNTANQQGATVAGGETNTASGIDASVGGGTGNTAGAQNATVSGGKSNQANSTSSTVGGGELNIAQTNTHATISGGKSNSATGQYSSVGGGDANTASGVNASVPGGSNNTAAGNYSTASGLRSNATLYGERAHASGYFAAIGDAQVRQFVGRRVVTTATPTEIRADGGSTQFVLPDDTTWAFRIQVVARNTATDAESAAYFVQGAIRRGAGAATTTLVGTPLVTAYEDAAIAAAWDFAVTADATNGALSPKFTGEAAKNIQVVGDFRITQTTG